MCAAVAPGERTGAYLGLRVRLCPYLPQRGPSLSLLAHGEDISSSSSSSAGVSTSSSSPPERSIACCMPAVYSGLAMRLLPLTAHSPDMRCLWSYKQLTAMGRPARFHLLTASAAKAREASLAVCKLNDVEAAALQYICPPIPYCFI